MNKNIMKRFKNKVVLVTGSSRNTGVGIAELFIREGAKVIVCGTTKESTSKGAEELRSKGYDGFIEAPCDISNLEQVKELFDFIKKECGRIDILVNNACQMGCDPIFWDLDPKDFMKVINVNLYGTFIVSQHAVRMMLEQPERGVIVNLSSNTSKHAIRQRTAYIASKGGIDALTRSMAIDLAPMGIRVNTVAPGYIHSERWDHLDESKIKRRRLNTPIGTEAYAEDIAQAVAFLASDAAKCIVGERLLVDSGSSAQAYPVDIDV